VLEDESAGGGGVGVELDMEPSCSGNCTRCAHRPDFS
jgi:hypothetical protein